jgi:O-antigen ligase
MPTIIRRFQNAPKQSAETRHYFNDAAAAMAQDRLFGCGINNYAWALRYTDYYWGMYPEALALPDPEAFRESESGQSRLGTCHNIYWLFAGETGYPGMILLIIMYAVFYLQVLRGFFRAKDPLSRAVFCGLATGLPLLYIHSKLEWVWRQTQAIYLYFILAGLMVAVGTYSERLRAQKKRRMD